ncbi:SAM-dependent methyltransferase related to tRNA (uracil-5-)-methyltransferase [Serpentinimonas raichei]|uniref:23S rRNA (uracil(1939)-C(5))-methyltransferase RlmD n=1 Tax=Serpentinimonas raichei TaxID=1458425 RepID=A0A060NJF0_9BURK|nr:SAM-dependent methyltransferase related to tRNA (uracil-5-)-methyltransferase [Serpentinimonas raichei]
MACAETSTACPEPVNASDCNEPAACPETVALPCASLPPAGWLRVDAMDLDAQGVARRPDGKVVFIDGALPTEWVSAKTRRSKNQWEQADLSAIHRESALRVQPRCPHFGLHAGACGGCKMQHLDTAAQVAVKQRVLEDNLWHLAKVRPDSILPAIAGPAWGYRYRARLSVRYVHKKGQVLIGFHERKSRYVADMRVCPVLPPHVSALLLPLRELFGSMDARETCPQIELAVGDAVTALVLRHLQPLSAADCARLRAFAHSHGSATAPIQWWLQPKGPDTAHLLDADAGQPCLDYALSEFGLRMPFRPTDFTQVNPHINRVLVGRAVRLLAPQAHERVIDWFCGLGNFTLPLATRARAVLGIEGSASLVARAQANWAENQGQRGGLAPTRFEVRNLFEITPQQLCADGVAEKWLVDPPREGAFALVKALADWQQAQGGQGDQEGQEGVPQAATAGATTDWRPPQRIVYVSCNPSTLARDAGLLVHQAGYRCAAAGVVNMFAHTAHVESMAVFERADAG